MFPRQDLRYVPSVIPPIGTIDQSADLSLDPFIRSSGGSMRISSVEAPRIHSDSGDTRRAAPPFRPTLRRVFWDPVWVVMVTARPYTSSSRATTVHQLECQLTGPPSWVSTRSVHRARLSCRSAHLAELASPPAGLAHLAELASSSSSPSWMSSDSFVRSFRLSLSGCGLTFPLPEALVRYLAALEIALPQLTPNLLRTILGIITVAAEAGYIIGVPELNELLSVRSSSKKTGYFSAYPNANRNIISNLPNKDENWHHPWFLIKKTPASIGNLSDVLPSKWSAKPAFIAPTLPTEEFIGFFKIILEGETLWNSFTLDRFIEANRKLRISPTDQLHRLPPPPSTQGMSARALTAHRKMLSKPIAEACDEYKALLATAVDKKDYSRTLLVDDGTAEGARSTGAFRLTPRRERRGDRSPWRARSPRRDSPRPPRDDFSSEPLKNLIRKKRDKSSRSESSPQREKSRARTDRSPRSSPPTEPMGPPPPVDMSSQHSGEKTARSASPLKEGSGSRDAPLKSKPVLVPQVKSLSAMEKEGSVFRCFKTRTGATLPDFDKWRPAIRERYLLHAHHSSRANSELNDIFEHYEGLLLSRQQEIDSWKSKLTALETDLHSSSGSKKQVEDQVDGLKSELEKIKGELKDQYDQKYQLQNELSGVQGRLHESESAADTLNNQLIELHAKYKAITKLHDSELARSASKAREEVKGRGMELIQGAIRFIQTEKVKSDLESDIKEHESNLILLDQVHEKDFSEVKERSELTSNLSEKRSRLAALPASSFNPQHFEEFFTESPPISESGIDWAGSSGTEGVVPSEVPAAPEVTPGDDCTTGNEQGASSYQAPAKEAGENPTTEVESEVIVDPADQALLLECENRARLKTSSPLREKPHVFKAITAYWGRIPPALSPSYDNASGPITKSARGTLTKQLGIPHGSVRASSLPVRDYQPAWVPEPVKPIPEPDSNNRAHSRFGHLTDFFLTSERPNPSTVRVPKPVSPTNTRARQISRLEHNVTLFTRAEHQEVSESPEARS
ncbi:hypothetical protein ISN44_Un89g000010, partial [Arabidopsis suecica]